MLAAPLRRPAAAAAAAAAAVDQPGDRRPAGAGAGHGSGATPTLLRAPAAAPGRADARARRVALHPDGGRRSKRPLMLGVFVWALAARGPGAARSLAFSVLVFAELFRAFAARSTTRLFWEVGPLTNRLLLGVVVFSVGLQGVLYELPAARELFGLGAAPLGAGTGVRAGPHSRDGVGIVQAGAPRRARVTKNGSGLDEKCQSGARRRRWPTPLHGGALPLKPGRPAVGQAGEHGRCTRPRACPSNPRHLLHPLSSLLLSAALGCAGPAPEQDTSQALAQDAQGLSTPGLPPGLAPSLVKDIHAPDQSARSELLGGLARCPHLRRLDALFHGPGFERGERALGDGWDAAGHAARDGFHCRNQFLGHHRNGRPGQHRVRERDSP